MTDWLDTLLQLREARQGAVVVTVASTKGSVPREAGTRMIITSAAIHGTIGGGHLEHKAIAIAREQLARNADGRALHRFPLGASLGQCCGGLVNLLFEPAVGHMDWLDSLAAAQRNACDAVVVTVANGDASAGKLVVTSDTVGGSPDMLCNRAARELATAELSRDGSARLLTLEDRLLYIEVVRASDFPIVLFGAGHVGRALVRALADLPCRVTWVDERDDAFPRDVPANVTAVCTDAPEAEVDAAPAGAYFLVMTHSHAQDEVLAERILRRSDHAFFGLIGSLTKRRAFERRIERRGVPADRFATMTCPIGVAGIPGKDPATIAVAVAAQLLQARARIARQGCHEAERIVRNTGTQK